jgi:polysaccharide export outer membrane protein
MGPVSTGKEPEDPAASATIIPVSWDLLERLNQPMESVAAPPALPLEPYRLGRRDVLRITVHGHPELSDGGQTGSGTSSGGMAEASAGTTAASGKIIYDDGKVFVPLLGRIQAAGLTAEEFRANLTRAMARLVRDPQVEVSISAYRSQRVFLAGEFDKKGTLPITDQPLFVADAIGLSGGTNVEADLTAAILTRAGKVYPLDLDRMYYAGEMSANVLLTDGDVITIPNRAARKVYVLGEVGAPRSYIMRRGRLSLAEVLADAGGPNPLFSNTGQLFVIRADAEGKPVVYVIDARSPVSMVMADQFTVYPRDLIYLDPTGLARIGRVIGQINQLFYSVSGYKTLTQ